jgi:hypothetical protein
MSWDVAEIKPLPSSTVALLITIIHFYYEDPATKKLDS